MAQARLSEAQQQVSSGKRITKLSDDPFGAVSSLSLRSLRSSIEQYTSNLNSAKGSLGYSEQALSDTSDLIKRAYSLAVQGANGATTQDSREGIISEITQIQSRVVDLANTRGPKGEYIFAGQNNDTQPYTVLASTGISFSGDTNSVVVETDANSTMAVNTPGEPMFSNLYNQLETLKNNLIGGNTGAISNVSIADMQASQKAFDTARAHVGVKLQTVADLTSQFSRRKDELTTNISDIEEVDYAEAITKYSLAQTAYQAALTVAGQGSKMSLMDFITG